MHLHVDLLCTSFGLRLPCVVLQLITNNGRSVHPNAVSIREQDPLERADWFQEGVHHVPETEDFLHALGHWKSSDHDLIWRRWAVTLIIGFC